MRARVSRPRARTVRTVLALSALAGPAALAGFSLAPADAAPAARPSLRIFSAQAQHDVSRPKGQPAWAPLPVYVTPVGGTFDLRVRRPDYFSPISVTQVVHESDSTETSYDLPGVTTKGWRGLKQFATISVTDPRGSTTTTSPPFCPDNWEVQRLDDPAGPDTPTFPEWCEGMPLTKGAAWGIDQGWATPIDQRGAVRLDGPTGDWTVTVSVSPAYQEAFGIAPEDATTTVVYHVTNGPGAECRGCRTTARPAAARPQESGPRSHVRIVETPPTDNLPDLQALPSFAIGTENRHGKDFLSFASTVWIGGTSRMDIEGFRRSGEDVMDAYQYFYDGDQVVGRALVGTLEFDTRRGHHHWHLEQFARYRLLDKDQQHVRLSKKQSFCLAPTDPVDLAMQGAALRQSVEDLGSACGGDEAVWIRETLPLGWGDTYYQSRGGQDFNITDVPNGTYYVSVKANPTDELYETDKTNNQSLRKVILKGKPGNRRVCVPAVGVIPAEGSCGSSVG